MRLVFSAAPEPEIAVSAVPCLSQAGARGAVFGSLSSTVLSISSVSLWGTGVKNKTKGKDVACSLMDLAIYFKAAFSLSRSVSIFNPGKSGCNIKSQLTSIKLWSLPVNTEPCCTGEWGTVCGTCQAAWGRCYKMSSNISLYLGMVLLRAGKSQSCQFCLENELALFWMNLWHRLCSFTSRNCLILARE